MWLPTPALQLKPIYWEAIDDEAMEGTWWAAAEQTARGAAVAAGGDGAAPHAVVAAVSEATGNPFAKRVWQLQLEQAFAKVQIGGRERSESYRSRSGTGTSAGALGGSGGGGKDGMDGSKDGGGGKDGADAKDGGKGDLDQSPEAVARRAKAEELRKEALIFETQRAVNIEITLAKIGMSGPEIVNAIETTDEVALSKNQLELLRLVLPDMEETRALMKFMKAHPDTNPRELRKAEQVSWFLLKLPRMQSRVHCFWLKSTLAERTSATGGHLATLRACAAEMMHSRGLRQVLQLVLQLGNFMNQGSSRGGAVGMKLAALEKLATLKASTSDPAVLATSGRTLLHFLARVADTEKPEALHTRESLPHLRAACAVDQEGIERELKDFKRALAQFKHEIQAGTAELEGGGAPAGGAASATAAEMSAKAGSTRRKKPKPPKPKPPAPGGGGSGGAPAAKQQHPYTLFFESLTREVARLEALQAEVAAEMDALYAGLGETRSTMPPQDLFKTVDGFLSSLGKAHAELLQAGRDRQRQLGLEKRQEELRQKRLQLNAKMQAHKAGRRSSLRRSSLAKSRRLAGGSNSSSSRRKSRRTSRLSAVNESTGRVEKRRSTVVHVSSGGGGGGGILETLIGHAKDGAWKDGAFRKTRLADARNARYEQVHGHQSSESESDSDWDDDI